MWSSFGSGMDWSLLSLYTDAGLVLCRPKGQDIIVAGTIASDLVLGEFVP